MIMEVNAFKMLEVLFEEHNRQHKIHEKKIERLEFDLEELKKLLKSHS